MTGYTLDSMAGAWPQHEKFTLPGHLFSHVTKNPTSLFFFTEVERELTSMVMNHLLKFHNHSLRLFELLPNINDANQNQHTYVLPKIALGIYGPQALITSQRGKKARTRLQDHLTPFTSRGRMTLWDRFIFQISRILPNLVFCCR